MRQFLACCLCLAWAARAAAVGGLQCPANTTADDVLGGLDLSGLVAVVTGGDSGLGFATAMALARRRARVVIASRNLTKAAIAAEEIAKTTGEAVTTIALNLASLASVRAFAASFLEEFGPKLNFLVNNAGICAPSATSIDGYELVFEVDYLGHFLLTELLLPALRASSPARVVSVSGGYCEFACEIAGWPEGCFKDWTYLPPPVVPHREVVIHSGTGTATVNSTSCGVAKFLNVQHAKMLAQREAGAGVEAFSITPGMALTGMTAGGFGPGMRQACEAQIHPDPSLPPNPCPFSADQAAAVIAFGLSGRAGPSGAYLSRTWACEARATADHGLTESMRMELYERSLQWAHAAAAAESSGVYI